MKQSDQKLILGIGALAIGYFGILRPILTKLGIQKTQSDRIIDRQENLPNNLNPFSPLFYKYAPTGSLLLTTAQQDNLSKRIYDALGVFADDESAIYSVFRSLKSQTQVSILSEYFSKKYKTDLLDYLKRGYSSWNYASGLSAEELNTVLSIVNALPKYR